MITENEKNCNRRNSDSMERIMDYLLNTTDKNKMLIWRRLITIMAIANMYARSNILDTFTRISHHGHKTPLIANIYFTQYYRNQLTSAGIDQETVDELFPTPGMATIVKRTMLGSR